MTLDIELCNRQIRTIINAVWPREWTDEPAPPECIPPPRGLCICEEPLGHEQVIWLGMNGVLRNGAFVECSHCGKKRMVVETKTGWALRPTP